MDNAPDYNDLRADHRMVIDFPHSKVMVYANCSGHVVLMLEEDGERVFSCIEPEDIDKLCAALKRARDEALPLAAAIDAEIGAYEVIQKVMGA